MKRPFHNRASRDVRPRRQSAVRRSMVSPGESFVRVEHVGRVEGDFANVISQYDYTYDAAGRRIEIARSGSAMSESRTDSYGYNLRNELTSATKQGGASPEYAYNYDDIGNRIMSTDLGTNRTYIANNLTPNFSDADKSYIKLGENDSVGTVAYYMSNGKKLKRIEPLRTDDFRDVRSGGNIQVSGWPVDPLEVELSLEDDVP